MRRRRLIWQFFSGHLLVIILALITVTWYTTRTVRAVYFQEMTRDLEARANLVQRAVDASLPIKDPRASDALVRELAALAQTRITIILSSGAVVGDSAQKPADMDDHSDRPEVQAALQGEIGIADRFSHTLQENMLYLAMPLKENETVTGVLRLAVPSSTLDTPLRHMYLQLLLGSLAVGILALFVGWTVSRRITLPLEDIRRGAVRFAEGDFSQRLPLSDAEEIAGLADAMNTMAAQLDERMKTVIQQRNEREAMLASMVESLLAIDKAESIISINRAAGRLLGVEPARVEGKSLASVVRNSALQQFVRAALRSAVPIETEIVLHSAEELVLQAHGTRLQDAGGQEIGAVVVLHDVTRLRKLERVRRDFVANVSHELKTPITSIKGFVETLLSNPEIPGEDRQRFLGIIAKHADRLGSIIEDLLTLSRIEQDEGYAGSVLRPSAVEPVILAAVAICAPAAQARNITIETRLEPGLQANLLPALLEQGIVNLLDNAIKYSAQGDMVLVESSGTNQEVRIRVADQGQGIPPEHHQRIFERFYRVDKARSRPSGGTGLGLAIVKHIATAHGGTVEVQSHAGGGSVFTLRLQRTRLMETTGV